MQKIYEKVEQAFFNHDPMDIGVKENELYDEYEAEVEMLMDNHEISEFSSKEELLETLNDIFEEMFDIVPEFTNEFILDLCDAFSITD